MIHRSSGFELRQGVDVAVFVRDCDVFLNDLRDADRIAGAGSPGAGINDAPMDKVDRYAPAFRIILQLRDRAQLDVALVHIDDREGPGTCSQHTTDRLLTDSIFLRPEDNAPEKETP